jgi:hypothetical protein
MTRAYRVRGNLPLSLPWKITEIVCPGLASVGTVTVVDDDVARLKATEPE